MGITAEALELFAGLYQNCKDAVFLCDSKGEILYCNPAFVNEFGRQDHAKNLFPSFPEENPKDSKTENWEKKPLSLGTEKLCLFSHLALAPSKLLLLALNTVLHSVDDGISAIDASGHFILYNHGLENMEGYQAKDVIGKHILEIYNINEKTSMMLRAIRERTTIRDYRQHYSMKNNRTFEVIIESIPLIEDNKVVGALAIYKDYTVFEKMTKKYYFLQEGKKRNGYYINKERNDPKQPPQLIGNSPKFLESLQMVQTAAASNSAVMIYGETGTGKELFANQIHRYSSRAQHPFIAINCAAIPESLLESLLFGTVKGAFTGAVNSEGLFSQANGGTVFLDEINSMPMSLQAKILRAIEEKQIRRLGDKETIPIDIRIISSTNQDITLTIEKGQIRSDLFFRLAVFYIQIPPLRERIDDLDLLISFFIGIFNQEMKKNIIGVQPDVLNGFKEYPWPGNVRQLKNIIECAMNFVDDKETILQEYHIPRYANILKKQQTKILELPQDKKGPDTRPIHIIQEIKEEEKLVIIDTLKETGGNISQAAKRLGISRQALQYKMKKYHLV